MNKKTIQTLLNPIMMRIIMVMLNKNEVSTKDILKEVDVPQATLYRHMAKLEKNNIIHVVKEEYKRGSYEKRYQLIYDPFKALNDVALNGTIEEKQNMFMMFMLNIVDQYNNYIENDKSDMIVDQTGFRTYPLYLSKKENEEFVSGLGQLLGKFIKNNKDDDRMQYHFSFVHLKGE